MTTTSALSQLTWVDHFSTLGNAFYTPVTATPLRRPYWVHVNQTMAKKIGLSDEKLRNDACLEIFSGANTINDIPSLAMVYAGHQFGGFSPQLGDGRGLLLGQLQLDDGILDVHLKGAGKTPYSRFGDGRAVLRSSIREYLAGEAMYHLGIPSSRALCLTASHDPVARETIETAAMVTRLAKTHIRFGHFEYFHSQGMHAQVKQLADHLIQQFLPEHEHKADQYQALFHYTVKHTALMIAKWQSVGFAHGVMNTDNMSMIGETLDYGPYAFLDDYDPEFICNHSDNKGRYAFEQQPSIGLWNLNVLAHSLSSLMDKETLSSTLSEYEPILVDHYAELMRKKFGWENTHSSDHQICAKMLHLLTQDKVDYTLFFRRLSHFLVDDNNSEIAELFQQKDKWQQWQKDYQERLTLETRSETERHTAMQQANPKFVLRNYLLQIAIEKAQNDEDFSEIDRLMTIMQSPFDEQPENESYAAPPPSWGKSLCISCSS